jgi:hypothetical protein
MVTSNLVMYFRQKTTYRRRNTMTQRRSTAKRGKIIQIDEEQVKDHLGEIVRGDSTGDIECAVG